MSWTDERVEVLKKLWADGLSASQIAMQIGGVSRNAVIGKVHRLGLSGRATTSRMQSHRQRSKASSTKRIAKTRFPPAGNAAYRALCQLDAMPFVEPQEELVIPLAERQTIETIEFHHCRWPIGDPTTPEFHFCGRSKVTGLPYCEFHARRAFQPPQPRRRDHGPQPILPAPSTATPITEGEEKETSAA